MNDRLIAAIRQGAPQQELLEIAVDAGVSLYELPDLVAAAARARDLRALVRYIAELNLTAHWGNKALDGAVHAARSMAIQLAPAGTPTSVAIGQALSRWCGDLLELQEINELLLPPQDDQPSLRAVLSTAIRIIAPKPAASSQMVAARLGETAALSSFRWTPKTLARTLAPAGVRPVRLRLDGMPPGVRGYRRCDLESASQQLFDLKCHALQAPPL